MHTLLQSDGIGLGADVNKFLPKLLLPQFLHAKKGFSQTVSILSENFLGNFEKLHEIEQNTTRPGSSGMKVGRELNLPVYPTWLLLT